MVLFSYVCLHQQRQCIVMQCIDITDDDTNVYTSHSIDSEYWGIWEQEIEDSCTLADLFVHPNGMANLWNSIWFCIWYSRMYIAREFESLSQSPSSKLFSIFFSFALCVCHTLMVVKCFFTFTLKSIISQSFHTGIFHLTYSNIDSMVFMYLRRLKSTSK